MSMHSVLCLFKESAVRTQIIRFDIILFDRLMPEPVVMGEDAARPLDEGRFEGNKLTCLG